MSLNRSKIAAAALAALATAAVGLAAPAAADSQAHRDPRGDVETLSTPQRAAKPGVDIVSLKNTYQGTTLTLSLTMADLAAKGYAAEWFVKTADDAYVLVFDHRTKKPVVSFDSIGGTLRHPVPLGHARRGDGCTGVKAVARGDSVIGSIPRSCLGGADEVKIAGLTVEPTESSAKVDDSRQKGIDADSLTFKFGPKLERN